MVGVVLVVVPDAAIMATTKINKRRQIKLIFLITTINYLYSIFVIFSCFDYVVRADVAPADEETAIAAGAAPRLTALARSLALLLL